MEISIDGPRLVLRGDLDGRSTQEVRAALYDRLGACDGDVVVDLTEVTAADVIGLRVLAAASRYADRRGRRIVLRGAGGGIRRLLHLSHLVRVVELERSLEGAEGG